MAAPETGPINEITKLADDVYLFRHQSHQAIFVVTAKGVIVTDPISVDADTLAEGGNQEADRSTCAVCNLQPPPQ